KRRVGGAEGGVGDRQRGLFAQAAGELDGSELDETVMAARRRGLGEIDVGQFLAGPDAQLRFAVGTVDSDIGEIVEQLRSAVGADASVEQMRALLDEGRRQVPGNERGGVENGLEEADVR